MATDTTTRAAIRPAGAARRVFHLPLEIAGVVLAVGVLSLLVERSGRRPAAWRGPRVTRSARAPGR